MKKRGQYEVQDAYENANTSRQGLGVRELRGALRELSVEATANETIKMLQTYNKTGSGKLSLDEFTALIEGLDAFESEEAADTAVGAADCAAHPFDEPLKPEVPPAREPHDPPLKPPPIIVGGPPGPLPVPDGFRYVTALGVGYGRHRKPKGSTPRSSVEPARTRSAEGLLRGSVEFLRFNRDGSTDRRLFGYDAAAAAGSAKNPVLMTGDVIRINDSVLSASLEVLNEVTGPVLTLYSLYRIFQP